MSDSVWKRHCYLEVFGFNYCVTLNYEINFGNSNYKWCRVNDFGCRLHNIQPVFIFGLNTLFLYYL
jgi:hypothetical protein